MFPGASIVVLFEGIYLMLAYTGFEWDALQKCVFSLFVFF